MQSSPKRTFLWLILLTGLGALAACGTPAKAPAANGYHTISVNPRRDSDLALKCNNDGMNELDKGHLDAATKAFTEALEADVEFGPAHNNLGKVYFQQKQWYKAAWEFQYAADLLPRYAEPRNNLALVWEQSGQLDSAIEQYRLAVSMSPEIQYRANLARCLLRRDGHSDEVRGLLTQILDRDTRPEWRDWARRELAASAGH